MLILDVKQYKATVLVASRWDLATLNFHELQEEFGALNKRLQDGDCKNFVLDLRTSTSLPMCVVDILQTLSRNCAEIGGTVRICCDDQPGERARNVGLQVYADFETAMMEGTPEESASAPRASEIAS